MLGVLMITVATFLDEISNSFGKWNVVNKKEGIYTMGFLNLFWGLIFFIIIAVAKQEFVFSLASIPLFTLALVATIVQVYSSLQATIKADRSTVGFIMVGTIPLLMVVDAFLGYDLTGLRLVGVSIIVWSIVLLFLHHNISKNGLGYVIFSTINGTLTISLYKYLVTHYNSVEAQNIVMFLPLLIFLFIMAKWKCNENPLTFVFKKHFFAQGLARGVGEVLIGFSYLFAAASVITSARRGLAVLWSIVSGRAVFKESDILVKGVAFGFVIIGLTLLVI